MLPQYQTWLNESKLILLTYTKGLFFYETHQKILGLLGGKIKFKLAQQPSTASTAKIQIQFSRQGV